jgi:type 2A phosphatase activator TIP41
MPTMVFPHNHITIVAPQQHFKLSFRTQDALSRVDNRNNFHLKVSAAPAWMQARQHIQDIQHVGRAFDWSYSTDYRGTLSTDAFTTTSKQLDMERLKRKDPILFYDETLLFEDELADHGLAQYSLKLRVMPSCFLLLARFYMRLDTQLYRVNETRVYHAFEEQTLLREFVQREAPVSALTRHPEAVVDSSLLMDPQWVSMNLPMDSTSFSVVEEIAVCEK